MYEGEVNTDMAGNFMSIRTFGLMIPSYHLKFWRANSSTLPTVLVVKIHHRVIFEIKNPSLAHEITYTLPRS